MALTRAQLTKFYVDRKPYLDEVIGKDFKEHPGLFSQWMNMKSTNAGWIDTNTIGFFGLFNSKAELVESAEDTISQGPVGRATVLTYAKRHMISQEAIEDDQGDGIIAQRLPKMLMSARATQEVLAHEILNGGFARTTLPDASYLYADTHDGVNGHTYDNKLASDFVAAQLEAAITLLDNMTDDRGIPIMQTAKTLVVPTALRWLSAVTLNTSGSVGNDYNDTNPLHGLGIKVVVSPYIDDSDSWFLMSDNHDLDWNWRITPENWSEVNYQKGGVEIGARFRCVASALDGRSTIGSTGSG